MSIFDFLKPVNINHAVEEFNNTPGAVLLDVRTPQEYREGHIPGSMNIPLNSIQEAQAVIDDKDAKIYVYCLSGGRSSQAVAELRDMGFNDVKNIGGISRYTGKRV